MEVHISGWIDKETVVSTHAADYYSAMKKVEILPFVSAWMDPEGIALSEMSDQER